MRRLPLLLLLGLFACKIKEIPNESDSIPESPSDDSAVQDQDGDGSPADQDCDDADPSSYPGAAEACDGVDNDCDGETDEGVTTAYYPDGDADGYGTGTPTEACDPPFGTAALDGDCDDADPAIHPGAPETDCADPTDYNCDGSTGYDDQDGDGYPACQECDDGAAGVYPGAEEVCDGIDNNCDGSVDEGQTSTFYMDTDNDGFGDSDFTVEACEAPTGYAEAGGDCDDNDPAVHPAAAELCDGVDNDCDALVDDADDSLDPSSAGTWYGDADQDGYGDPATATVSCTEPTGAVSAGDDCDDADAAVNPGAAELCDGLDNDCDGLLDQDDPDLDPASTSTWYSDADQDGFGDPATATAACSQPAGTVSDATDCDDADAAVNPDATELCDSADNDCDGTTDEADAADAQTWYRDADGDRYGDAAQTTLACTRPSGYRGNDNDCDDSAAAINPAATEVCDGLDNDCDQDIDDADPSLDLSTASSWYDDGDSDGYGDPNDLLLACDQPVGAVTDNTDCDDTDAAVGPGGDTDNDGTADCFDDDDDGDGLSDDDELAGIPSGFPTDPLDPDTDGDGVDDGADAVPTNAACSAALLFYDDFTGNPSGTWTTVSGTWSWDGSELYSITSTTSGGNAWIGSQSWTDYVLEARIRPDANSNDLGLMSRVSSVSATNDANRSYYVGIYPAANEVRLGYMDGSWHSLVAASVTIDPSTWYTVQLRQQGSALSVYVDGVQRISTTNTQYSSGSIGLRSYRLPGSYDYVLACQ